MKRIDKERRAARHAAERQELAELREFKRQFEAHGKEALADEPRREAYPTTPAGLSAYMMAALAWGRESAIRVRLFEQGLLVAHSGSEIALKAIERLEAANDELLAVKQERDRLVESLTPSPETKRDYWGGFSFECLSGTSIDGEDWYQRMHVPWTTIKEILAAVLKRAGVAMHPETGCEDDHSDLGKAVAVIGERRMREIMNKLGGETNG